MASAAQLEANRANSLRSTGPRTAEGKARSAMNAVTHNFRGQLLVGLLYGPFADDEEDLQAFMEAMLEELAPRTAQEKAEALHLIGLYVRRGRLVDFESQALTHNTLPAATLSGSPAVNTAWAGSNALSGETMERIPRYEAHLSKEIDRSRARYASLQSDRQRKEEAITGEVVRTPMVIAGNL